MSYPFRTTSDSVQIYIDECVIMRWLCDRFLFTSVVYGRHLPNRIKHNKIHVLVFVRYIGIVKLQYVRMVKSLYLYHFRFRL